MTTMFQTSTVSA